MLRETPWLRSRGVWRRRAAAKMALSGTARARSPWVLSVKTKTLGACNYFSLLEVYLLIRGSHLGWQKWWRLCIQWRRRTREAKGSWNGTSCLINAKTGREKGEKTRKPSRFPSPDNIAPTLSLSPEVVQESGAVLHDSNNSKSVFVFLYDFFVYRIINRSGIPSCCYNKFCNVSILICDNDFNNVVRIKIKIKHVIWPSYCKLLSLRCSVRIIGLDIALATRLLKDQAPMM